MSQLACVSCTTDNSQGYIASTLDCGSCTPPLVYDAATKSCVSCTYGVRQGYLASTGGCGTCFPDQLYRLATYECVNLMPTTKLYACESTNSCGTGYYDCDTDTHCMWTLKCLQRDGGTTAVQGMADIPPPYEDVCYDPTWQGLMPGRRNTFTCSGASTTTRCGVGQGPCVDDAGCRHAVVTSFKCMLRTNG